MQHYSLTLIKPRCATFWGFFCVLFGFFCVLVFFFKLKSVFHISLKKLLFLLACSLAVFQLYGQCSLNSAWDRWVGAGAQRRYMMCCVSECALGVCAHGFGGLELLWKFVSLSHKHLYRRGLLFASSFLTALLLFA